MALIPHMSCKRAATLLQLLAIMTAGAACSGEGQRSGDSAISDAACIVADTTYHNVGDLDYADVVAVTNRLSNKGQKVVKLTEVTTDCSCLSAQLESNSVEPGASVKLNIELDTHGEIGKQFHLVSIKAENGQTIKICVSANVAEPKK